MRGPWIAGGNPRHSVRGASVVTCQDVTSQSPGCGIQQGERGGFQSGNNAVSFNLHLRSERRQCPRERESCHFVRKYTCLAIVVLNQGLGAAEP